MKTLSYARFVVLLGTMVGVLSGCPGSEAVKGGDVVFGEWQQSLTSFGEITTTFIFNPDATWSASSLANINGTVQSETTGGTWSWDVETEVGTMVLTTQNGVAIPSGFSSVGMVTLVDLAGEIHLDIAGVYANSGLVDFLYSRV